MNPGSLATDRSGDGPRRTRGPLAERAGATLRERIREIPDHPAPGIVFYDITTLLADAAGLAGSIAALSEPVASLGITHVVGIEARGFIFAAPVAHQLAAGFVPVRKPGKLPGDVVAVDYSLEYGTDRLEIHTGAVGPDHRVLVVDDVLATGGTAEATCALVRERGATLVGVSVLVELAALGGRERLGDTPVHSVIVYE